jgi:hypothetical protein
VAGVQEIEHAVGERDPAPLGRAPRGCGVDGADLGGGVQSGWVALGWSWKVWLKSGRVTVSP